MEHEGPVVSQISHQAQVRSKLEKKIIKTAVQPTNGARLTVYKTMPRSMISLVLIVTVLFSTPFHWTDRSCRRNHGISSCSMYANADTTAAASPEPTYYEIMGLLIDASSDEIKKAYRKLALELHPDKLIRYNMTDEEYAAANERFLKIQEAYDALGDADKRSQYDLKMAGVQYDIPVEDTSNENRYMRSSRFGKEVLFNMFIKSKRFKMHFTAKLEKPKVPDVVVNLEVDLIYTLQGIRREHKYYKRVVCDVCRGTGAEGECKTCELCQGTGVAKHLYFHPHRHSHDGQSTTRKLQKLHQCSKKHTRLDMGNPGDDAHQDAHRSDHLDPECDVWFGSMTETSCAACGGTGCTAASKCPSCKGTGMKMEEASLTLVLSPGWTDKNKVTATGAGHEDFDGRRGDVIVNLMYKIPPTWTFDEVTGRLTCTQVGGLVA